jgi:TonB-dependent SusC/RagA subfamily outer membrane receptor
MKNYICYLLLFSISIGFAQDFKTEWREVIKFELDGKIQSASEVVDAIYKKSKRKHYDNQIIKCFFYQSKFLQVQDENYQSLVIQNLKSEVEESKGSAKALLSYIYADVLVDYYYNNNYSIDGRTDLQQNNSKDFKTWTKVDFQKEIDKTFAGLLSDEDELHKTTINEFASIFEISPYTDSKKISVYDFLQKKVIEYYFQKFRNSTNQNHEQFYLELIKNPALFAKIKTDTISDESLKIIITIFQNTEKYCLKNGNEDIDVLQYNRMKRFYNLIENKKTYFNALSELEQKTKNTYLLQDIKVDLAKHYFSLTTKESEKNYYPEVLSLIDTILKRRENPNAKSEAETLKEQILKKSLSLNIPNELYPFQNYRAFVTFKNVDTVKVRYYKISLQIFKELNQENRYNRSAQLKPIDRDSIVIHHIKNNQPIKRALKILPAKTDHFNYSTEILMDPLDLGQYLLFFETNNTYSNSKKAFAYKVLQVSNINFVQQTNQDFETFHLLERKTGKPIESAIVKNNESAVKSNKTGKARFELTSQKSNLNSELLFIKEKDTLYTTYLKTRKSDFSDDGDFEAKALVFFDRAIYRPGQKVYFKGYMFKNKNNVKSVVPNLTVHVIIEDANGGEVKAFDIQTNEFGSFTEEYDIPNNVLTGEFSIQIEEPEDYEADTNYYNKKEDEHAFWDNADYNDYQNFSFTVEEYKRPTFEITFDEIKENYTLGDSIIIKGNAKTLAGSNLTNAKVSFTVEKNISLKKGYFENGKNTSTDETTTDANGNFQISFIAKQDSIASNEIERINYFLEATVTDINGETRTQNSSVSVGNEMLALTCNIAWQLIQEEKNTLTINATTLNNFPINTKGIIRFLEQNKEDFLIDKEQFPELNSINQKEYEKLFPYEAYEKKDIGIKEKKVLTIPFDTEKSSIVDLSFLKNFNLTNYKIVLEATDQKGNEITAESRFALISKNKKATKKSLFIVNQIETDRNNFVFEIKSVIPDLYITTRLFDDLNQKSEEVIQLKNGLAIVKISRKSSYENDVHFHFSTLWENTYFAEDLSIKKEALTTQLDFEIVSMRNKIEPGSAENWSFVLKNSKLQSEVLASMYDTSLDQFASSIWKNEPFYNQKSTPQVSYRTPYWYNNNVSFNNFYFNSSFIKVQNSNPVLNWFGFNFNGKSIYLNNQYLKSVQPVASVPKNAKPIYGIVSDGEFPLPGVSVFVQGTNRGAQTDFDGRYQIEVVKDEKLIFSYMGFESAILTIGNKKNTNVKLKVDTDSLQEVIVIRYGSSTIKKFVSGSITIMEDNSIYASTITVDQILQGSVAGIQINSAGGQPGPNTTVRIRGASSVTGNLPLILVDGVPISEKEFQELNKGTILNIGVLKDNSAAALYGSRGANGVIIITTKSEMKTLQQVKTRTNFNETAFFYPNLTTDSKGNLNFSFTTPESLTKWRLRLFGHNKKAETGYFQTDIISQKDIMVMPNMPRFVREKDEIQFSTKVVNTTNETKSGNAVLLLFDAVTNAAIDSITRNSNNVKPFICKAKESVSVNWTVTIPEGVQGLRYKVIAKSGTVSDGEENILPVLTDKILVTESIPIWVKGNTKRDFTLENLKNNSSTTLQNHSLTFEYTSNPVWFALQALPYLMTYEHECSEQVFAKYYANCIAEKIISSNPKIEKLFQKWHDDKSVSSKLQLNEELKSIVLAETPWLLDAESDAEKNKRIAILMDLNTLKQNNSETFKKLEAKMLPTGGFPWFTGGSEDRFISQHILTGIGHLTTLFPEDSLNYKTIISKGIPNLDSKFVANYSKKTKIARPSTLDLNYLYTRSFYLKNHPLATKTDSLIQLQLKQCKEDWQQYSLYEKGLLALVMNRFNKKDFAKKIITSLKETVSNNAEIGMYWIENNSGYSWYQSRIATQALLIEAFAEIDKDKKTIDAMKVWLIRNKQTNRWPTTKSTTEAVYALFNQGNDWVSLKENTKIKFGDEKLLTQKLSSKEEDQNAGFLKIEYKADEITPKMATISVDNKSEVPGFGGLYWQYFESLENIKKDSTQTISIDKKLFKKVKTTKGEELVAISNETLKVGDLLTVRLIIKADTALEFVHLKDLRASGLEPIDVISAYEWKGNFSYYKSTKDVSTNFYFDRLNKGTYVLEYDLRVTNQGIFNSGISTLQSMYAPEFSTHSENSKVIVK